MKRKCPTPAKRAHATEGEAQRHLAQLRATQRVIAAKQHVYRCDCGAWHVGGKRRRKSRRKVIW